MNELGGEMQIARVSDGVGHDTPAWIRAPERHH